MANRAMATGPAAWLRGWPLLLMGAAVAGAALLSAGRVVSPPILILIGLGTYLVAAKLPRLVSIPVAVAAAALLSSVLLTAALRQGRSPAPGLVVESLLILVAAWFVGDAGAARRRYLVGLAEQAERERAAEAERAALRVRAERVRIAREMHDVVAHTLAVITVQAGVGRRLMASRPAEASSALASIEEIGRTAQDELRVVLGLLRDEDAGAAGLSPSPRLVDVKELADTVQASGTPVELLVSGDLPQLSPALELSVYRVVQEALTNVVKHAPLARARVCLTSSGQDIRIEVTDDGSAAQQLGPAGLTAGHGILGMRERVAAFGGWLVAEPLPGHGFRVLAKIPLTGAR